MSYVDGLLRSNGAWGYTAETPELIDSRTLAPISNKIAAYSLATTTIANSVAESDLFSLNIPTSVATGDFIRVTAGGTQLNNSAGAVNYTAKLYIGATNVLSTGATSLTNNANSRKWQLIMDFGLVSTASETGAASLITSATNPANWSALNTSFSFVGTYTATELLTATKAVRLTIQMGTADAAANMICTYAYLMVRRQYG